MTDRDLRSSNRFAQQPTEPPTRIGRPAAARHVRCRFARGSDTGPGLTDELSSLLRTRLRLAILIFLCGCLFYFVRNLWDTSSALQNDTFAMILQGCIIAVMAAVSAILWAGYPLCMRTLRSLELAVFAIIAAFFAWLHYAFFRSGVLLSSELPAQDLRVFRLVASLNAFRWLMLIVLYGTFIPNTWRRCAAVVGCMAVIPIALTVAASMLDYQHQPYLRVALPDTVVLMAIASAIAIFGSHKIQELHEKAYEAQKIGQYRLKEKLGSGGMGEVYLGEHVLLRRPCAIKLIRPDQAGDPKTLIRFEREVQATAQLTHWNTVEIFDYGHAEDGTFYYVMEYLPGMNLEDLVEQHGPMPPERVVHLLRQVCQALREAHSVGLIHRDIKPSNIFACERGKIYDVAKLLDFGMVKSFGLSDDGIKLTQEGSMAGSPAYMSPEQATGRRQLDARSDIYNLGAVGYFLMTGQLVFDRETPLQMLHAHAYEPIAPLPEFHDVPADLQRVVLRCLEKDPLRRYQDADSLEKALAECACASRWTRESAESWWRKNGAGIRSAAANEALQRDGPTILVRT